MGTGPNLLARQVAKMIQGTATKDVILVASLEVFYRGTRRFEISRVAEGARVSDKTFHSELQPKEAVVRAFLEDRNPIWLHWFQREIGTRFETTGGGLEIIAEVLRKWFIESCSQGLAGNEGACCSRRFDTKTPESCGTQKEQLRRFVERLAVKMGLRYPDIAASAAVQIIERTIVATLKSGDLAELKTAQLLFQCLQHALSVGFN